MKNIFKIALVFGLAFSFVSSDIFAAAQLPEGVRLDKAGNPWHNGKRISRTRLAELGQQSAAQGAPIDDAQAIALDAAAALPQQSAAVEDVVAPRSPVAQAVQPDEHEHVMPVAAPQESFFGLCARRACHATGYAGLSIAIAVGLAAAAGLQLTPALYHDMNFYAATYGIIGLAAILAVMSTRCIFN